MFTNRFITLPGILYKQKDDLTGEDEKEIEDSITFNPFDISYYHASIRHNARTIAGLKNGVDLTINLPIGTFERFLNDFYKEKDHS